MRLPRWTILLLPIVLYLAGNICNQTVIRVNGFQMPVEVHGCADHLNADNVVHKCMDKNTRLKPLGDIILASDGVSSIGDVLQDASGDLALPSFAIWLILSTFAFVEKVFGKKS